MSDLGAVLLGDPNDGTDRVPTLRAGVVTAIPTAGVGSLMVRVGSATTAQACASLNTFGARVGDVVQVLVVGGDRIVLGKVGVGGYGFHVTRSTNDSAVANTATGDITWNNVVEATWSSFSGFSTGSGLTVPADGAGLYAIHFGLYWAAALSGVYTAVANGAAVVKIPGAPSVNTDRVFTAGVARLAAGDVLSLRILNVSGSSITPTAYAGDNSTSPAMPFLRAWRIST